MRLTFEKAYEKYHAYMIRCNYSERTIHNKNHLLKLFCDWYSKTHEDSLQDFKSISCDDLSNYIDSLFLEGLRPSSVKVYMGYLRSFFTFLYKQDLIPEDPARKLPVVKVPKKEIVFIPHEEIIRVLDTMLKNPRKKGCDYRTAIRDYFIIRLAYVTGWRASESLNCDPSKDINWETGEIYLSRRKGGKDGYVYMDLETLITINKQSKNIYTIVTMLILLF